MSDISHLLRAVLSTYLPEGMARRSLRERAEGAFRDDIDALPIEEATGLDYASVHPGKMHACGHDGHTAMLLLAARQIAAEGVRRGTFTLIFQPAEENNGGARAIIEKGLFRLFRCDTVYGIHNWPGLPPERLLPQSSATQSDLLIDLQVARRVPGDAAPHRRSVSN